MDNPIQSRVFDITIILWSIFVGYIIQTPPKLYLYIPEMGLAGIVLGINIFLPYFLSHLTIKYIKAESRLKNFAIFVSVVIVGTISFGAPIFLIVKKHLSEGIGLTVLIISLVISIMSAVSADIEDEKLEKDKNKDKEPSLENDKEIENEEDNWSEFVVIFMMLSVLLGFFYGVYTIYLYGWWGVFSALALIIAAPFLTFLIAPILNSQFYQNFIHPAIIALTLCFWSDTMLSFYTPSASFVGKLSILIFSGILPVRFLMVFTPPLNKISALIGIISLIIFGYNIQLF